MDALMLSIHFIMSLDLVEHEHRAKQKTTCYAGGW